VSVILEAELQGAEVGVVIVQSFCENGDNWDDFCAFLDELKVREHRKGDLLGPAHLGLEKELPVYFLWLTEECAG
jgi:hypothetical protein